MRDIKLFISSTSDLPKEREVCSDVIIQVNREHPEFRIELVKWETHSNPIINTTFQEEINKELNNADIVCFVFYNRLGKHTKEEYEFVIENRKERLILQKEYSPKLSTLSIDDINRYLDLRLFLEGVSDSLGSFNYENIEGFKLHLRDYLGKYITNLKNTDFQAQGFKPTTDPLFIMYNLFKDHPELVDELERKYNCKA